MTSANKVQKPRGVVALALLLWTAAPSAAYAYYVERMLAEVIAEADVVVLGTIREVSGGKQLFPADHYRQGSTLFWTNCITVAVERVVKGCDRVKSDTLSIEGFVDWSCASRWTRYAPAQRVVLFLDAPAVTCKACDNAAWKIIGAGNEGEVPVQDDFAYFHAGDDGLAQKEYRVSGGTFWGERAPLATFLDAVTNYDRLFAWTFNHPNWPTIRQRATDAETAAYAAISPLHARLVRQARQYRALKSTMG